jgi:hypothetical protein
MNDRSSEQRPTVSPLLTPTDTLKQLWHRKTSARFKFNEYRQNGQPESLKAFADQLLKENGTYDGFRLIWTSDDSFVREGKYWESGSLPQAYRKHRFELGLKNGFHTLRLYIHSTTLEDTMPCLELLVGLHDDHFDEMTLAHHYSIAGVGPPICPLMSIFLEKILQQSAKRKNSFSYMSFTPVQSRTLATSGTRTDIGFNCCKFEDDGEAFLEALSARADSQTGLAKLTVDYRLPFTEGILLLFVHMLKCLTLNYIALESEEACRAVAQAELLYLEPYRCELGDGGASLVESVRVGRGPKGLCVDNNEEDDDWLPFDSSERFISFLNALRGNSHLEQLVYPDDFFLEEEILDTLAAALFENEGLVHLGLSNCHFDESSFCELLRAISTHPTLRTLDLTFIRISIMNGTEATKAVAEMLSVNKQLEEIRFRASYSSPFDCLAWHKLVTPRLECNVYRKRFPAIQEIRPQSTRAAVMASALARVSNKPSPAFML